MPSAPTVPVTPPPATPVVPDIQIQPGNTSLTKELEALRKRIQQLEDAKAKEKLDQRFADIRELIRKGDEQNAGEITAMKNDLSTLTGQQANVLRLLEGQRVMLQEMQQRLKQGVSMRTDINGRLGPIVTKPIGGEPFILDRSLIE